MYARYTEFLRDLMMNELTREQLSKAMSTYPLYQGKKEYDLIPTREQLNKKILDHYKYREIGFETAGRFIDELEIALNEIMPRYNELFKTIEIMADLENPFDNVDVTETFEQESSGTTNSEGTSADNQTGTMSNSGTTTQTNTMEHSGTTSASTSGEENDTHSDTSSTEGTSTEAATSSQTANSKTVKSDTPQSSLAIGTENIDAVGYASEAEWRKDTSNGNTSANSTTGTDTESSGTAKKTSSGTSEGSTSSTEESSSEASTASQSTTQTNNSGTTSMSSETSGSMRHTFTKKGNQGVNTYAHDMNEFRTSIIDVEYQIITDDRLDELFMRVW